MSWLDKFRVKGPVYLREEEKKLTATPNDHDEFARKREEQYLIGLIKRAGKRGLAIAERKELISKAKKQLFSLASVREIDELGNNALHYAVSAGDVELVKQLVAKGANIQQENFNEIPQTPLSIAQNYASGAHGHYDDERGDPMSVGETVRARSGEEGNQYVLIRAFLEEQVRQSGKGNRQR